MQCLQGNLTPKYYTKCSILRCPTNARKIVSLPLSLLMLLRWPWLAATLQAWPPAHHMLEAGRRTHVSTMPRIEDCLYPGIADKHFFRNRCRWHDAVRHGWSPFQAAAKWSLRSPFQDATSRSWASIKRMQRMYQDIPTSVVPAAV